jgi:hypothetical protein
LSQRTKCLLFTHVLCNFWRKVRGGKWMFKTEAPEGYCILHQLYLIDIISKLGQFHKRLYRKKKKCAWWTFVENITKSSLCLCFQVPYTKLFTNC